MPVYNGEKYLAQAIESILLQTLRSFEFLILDDGSTDRSSEIMQKYSRDDKRIRLFVNAHKGLTYCLNEGIERARGDFIARMDADDISHEDRLLSQLSFLHQNQFCVALGCDVVVIDQYGKPIGFERHETQPDLILRALLNGAHGVISHPASLIRRAALVAIGGYRKEFESIEDFDLWFRLAEQGQLSNIPELLLKYRLNPAGISSTQFRTQERLANEIITQARKRRGMKPLRQSVWPRIHSSNDEVARMQLWALYIAGLGNRALALQYARLSLLKTPLSLSSWMTLCRVILPPSFKNALRVLLRPAFGS